MADPKKLNFSFPSILNIFSQQERKGLRSKIARLQIGNLQLSVQQLGNFQLWQLQFWQFLILAILNFDNLTT